MVLCTENYSRATIKEMIQDYNNSIFLMTFCPLFFQLTLIQNMWFWQKLIEDLLVLHRKVCFSLVKFLYGTPMLHSVLESYAANTGSSECMSMWIISQHIRSAQLELS